MNEFEKEFNKKYGFYLHTHLNDYSFDRPFSNFTFGMLAKIKFKHPKEFKEIKKFILKNKNEMDRRLYFLLNGYLYYIEEDAERSVDCFFKLIDLYPTDIDSWINLCFALICTKKKYDLGMDMFFNIYLYIHYYQKYNFNTLNERNLKIIKDILHNSNEYENNYIEPIQFHEEFLTLSRRCNNNCITCPNEYRNYNIEEVCDFSVTPMDKYILAKIRKPYIRTLILTGGEPTIANNFFEIIRYIFLIRSDIKIVIQSNGRIFSSQKFLENLYILKKEKTSFEISIFSSDESVHDRITRVEGSWKEACEGIVNLLRKNYDVDINIPLCSFNYKKISDTINFIEKNFSSYNSFKKVNIILPVPSGNFNKFFVKGIKNMCGYIEKWVKNHKGIPIELRSYPLLESLKNNF